MNQDNQSTSRALVAREPAGLFPSAQQWQTMAQIAEVLVKSNLLPAHIKTPQAALAVMLKGAELGVPPMHALSSIVVVQGKPTCNAELMLALDYRDHGDDAIIISETTAERCTISYKRRGWKERRTYSFTMDDAQRAGLADTQTWKKYPQAMLRARAISAVSRMAFPDSIAGMYVYEEMGLPVEVDGGEQVVVEGSPSTLGGDVAAGEHAPDATKAAVTHDLDPAHAAPQEGQRARAVREPAAAAATGPQSDEPFLERTAAALAPAERPDHPTVEDQGVADLRTEVVRMLTSDGPALDLLKAKGTLPPEMTGEQLRKTKRWLEQRAARHVAPSTQLARQIEEAASEHEVTEVLRRAQTAKDQRQITQAEWLGLLREGETRRTALAGPLTAGAAP